MHPIRAAEKGEFLPPIAHPKKKMIVALAVAAGVTLTVSIVALTVLIPPVGAIAGAALVAAAIKVSIGAGAGSVLCGGAAYLIYKLNKPAKPEDPGIVLKGKHHIKAVDRSPKLPEQPDDKPSSKEPSKSNEPEPLDLKKSPQPVKDTKRKDADQKPNFKRNLDNSSLNPVDIQEWHKNDQKHHPDTTVNFGDKLAKENGSYDPAAVDVNALHKLYQSHQPDTKVNLGNKLAKENGSCDPVAVDVNALHKLYQSHQPDTKVNFGNKLAKENGSYDPAAVDVNALHKLYQSHQPDTKVNLGNKLAKENGSYDPAAVDVNALHKLYQSHQPDTKVNLGNKLAKENGSYDPVAVDVDALHKLYQSHQPDTKVNLGNKLGRINEDKPADLVDIQEWHKFHPQNNLNQPLSVPQGSPLQASRTPSPTLEDVEKLNTLMLSTIEKTEPINLNQSLLKEPMPHIGKDLTDAIPVNLLQKIVSDETIPVENVLPDKNIVEEPKQKLKGVFEVKDSKFSGPLELNSYLNCDPIDDNTNVAFFKGKLVPKESIKEPVDPKNDLLAILKANFRKELVDHLAKTFRFENKTDFTSADFKRICVTLLASLHDKDVKMLFETVIGKAKEEDRIGSATLISDEDKAYLKGFSDFEDVDQKGRKILLGAYYKLVIFDLNNVVPTSPEMLADLEIVQAFHSILPQLRRKEQEKLSRAEYLAKTLAYLELQVGQIVKVPRNAEEEDLYIVAEYLDHKAHQDETQAVICRILVPYQKDKSNAIILVRGTQTGSQVAALNSLIRDADYEGVGKGSFDKASPHIFEMIERTVQTKLKGDVTLEIQGHSLAGVDAQRVMHLVIRKISEGLLSSVKRILHFSHNPPGVSKAESDDFNERVNRLDPNIELEMNFITFSGDLISWFGSIYDGANRSDNRIKGSFYIANTTRYLLAAHTCVSTKNDLVLAQAGEKITGNKISYDVCDINSETGRKYLMKSYASRLAAIWMWKRYITKHLLHRPAFYIVRSFGKVERKLEDRNLLA